MSKPAQPSTQAVPFDVTSFLDTTRPHLARIFDYFVGGATHFEADRVAASKIAAHFPPLKKWTRLRKAFSFEAAQYLYAKGFHQFLDLGSGMPHVDAVHHLLPEAAFVYSDINPIAVSYGTSLFSALSNVAYVYGDARDLQSLLQAPEVRQTLHHSERVAIGLNNLTLFLSDSQIGQVAEQLYDWAPASSEMFVFAQTRADDADAALLHERFIVPPTQIGLPTRYRSLDAFVSLFLPWDMQRLIPIVDFMGLPPHFLDSSDGVDIGIQYHALFLVKP